MIEILSAITGKPKNSADIAGVLDAEVVVIALQALKGYERVKSILVDEQSNLQRIGSSLLATFATATDEQKQKLESALRSESDAKKSFGTAQNDVFLRIRDGVINGLESNHAPLIELRREIVKESQAIKKIREGDGELLQRQLDRIDQSNKQIEECNRQIHQYGPVVGMMDPLRIALNRPL